MNGKRATRPCKCGYLGHFSGKCRCTPDQVAQYRGRISGPLLDRIDLHVEVPALREEDLFSSATGEPSRLVRCRVARARDLQMRRQATPNSRLQAAELQRHAPLHGEPRKLLRDAVSRLSLSARAQHRAIKVARTIADLVGASAIRSEHIAEAIRYR